MNGKLAKKVRKEVNKQAFDQLEFVYNAPQFFEGRQPSTLLLD